MVKSSNKVSTVMKIDKNIQNMKKCIIIKKINGTYKPVESTCARTCLKQITYSHKQFIKHQIILKLSFQLSQECYNCYQRESKRFHL